jgi:hypothetical protein
VPITNYGLAIAYTLGIFDAPSAPSPAPTSEQLLGFGWLSYVALVTAYFAGQLLGSRWASTRE